VARKVEQLNKYGLSRNIPTEVKRTIRRRCGFGCVVCGNAIVTYEHIDPVYADAREHDPECMTLLCGGCQLESTKGTLSKKTIKAANNSPFCKRAGHAKHIFDLGGKRPKLLLGGNDFTDCGQMIRVDGETLFEIEPPERLSSRWRLSATFRNSNGDILCEIIENELKLNPDNFDIEQTARIFRVKSCDGSCVTSNAGPNGDA
jgi:hypothetical protein